MWWGLTLPCFILPGTWIISFSCVSMPYVANTTYPTILYTLYPAILWRGRGQRGTERWHLSPAPGRVLGDPQSRDAKPWLTPLMGYITVGLLTFITEKEFSGHSFRTFLFTQRDLFREVKYILRSGVHAFREWGTLLPGTGNIYISFEGVKTYGICELIGSSIMILAYGTKSIPQKDHGPFHKWKVWAQFFCFF